MGKSIKRMVAVRNYSTDAIMENQIGEEGGKGGRLRI